MNQDRLLAYLSEKGRGDWDELRDAWRWLLGETVDPADKAWVVAQDLSALGHLEVAWGDPITWSAAPPVLTMIPRSGGRALLTGGRTRALYEPNNGGPDDPGSGRLMKAAEELDLWVDEWRATGGPTTAMVACESAAEVQDLAQRLEVQFTYSVADQLARMLPDLPAYARLWVHGDLPRGFEAERFDTHRLRWVAAETTEAAGFYRCRTWQRHVHVLKHHDRSLVVPREQGVYEALRWDERCVLTYDRPKMELRVPVHARLPVLHSRTAVLCSGRLPTFVRRTKAPFPLLAYANVDPEIADAIAGSLAQRLELDG